MEPLSWIYLLQLMIFIVFLAVILAVVSAFILEVWQKEVRNTIEEEKQVAIIDNKSAVGVLHRETTVFDQNYTPTGAAPGKYKDV